jgi:hypothetical protein
MDGVLVAVQLTLTVVQFQYVFHEMLKQLEGLTLTVVQFQYVFHEMLKQLEGHNSTSTPISRIGNRTEVKFTQVTKFETYVNLH